MAGEHQEQLLAFVGHRNDVHVYSHTARSRERAHGGVPIEHGRELDDDRAGPLQQLVAQRSHVGRAVFDAEYPAAVGVAAGRIEVDDGGVGPRGTDGQPAQRVLSVAADHLGLRQSQYREVVTGQFAQLCVALHIDRTTARPGHEREVHAEASRQVDERSAARCLQQPGLVAGRGLGAALLHVEVGRIEYALGGRPGGQFAACRLPALYLVERERHVHARVTVAQQSQPDSIVQPVVENELSGVLGKKHVTKIHNLCTIQYQIIVF